MFVYLFVCYVLELVLMCQNVQVGVRGQPVGGSWFFPTTLCIPELKLRSGLGVSVLPTETFASPGSFSSQLCCAVDPKLLRQRHLRA